MQLFELRACWAEHYNCPDEGDVHICDTYETIAFAVDDDTRLKDIAEDLSAGFKGNCWSKTRADHLRKLYPGYDNFRDTTYVITEVTDLILT